MGFSARAQATIDEIGKADDWGLSASAFQLPPAGILPKTVDDQAVAEIKLQLAVLKYARFARGGRVNPSSLSNILDLDPPIRDPKIVLAEISVSPDPGSYLQSLHPKHEQFQNLRQALLKARGGDGASKPASERDIQKIVINMERWRWMPENLGKIYVQDNVPEYMLYVVKDGKVIHSDKIVVGLLRYATPVFSADMQSIVFNPEWTVPPTIVRENLMPNLRGGGWFGGSSILSEHGLKVKYNGRIVDAGSVNWSSVNMANIAFVQAPGPTNVLGKLKFVYPNKHMVYMHDTIKRGLFKPTMRAEGHNCIRMEKPSQLAQILLAEDKGWDTKKVQDLLDKGYDSAVNLDHPIPVHTTYFTAVADADGKVTSFPDVYALDSKLAPIVAGKAVASAATDDAMRTRRRVLCRRQGRSRRRKTWRGRSKDCSEISVQTPMPWRIVLALTAIAVSALLTSAQAAEPIATSGDFAGLIEIGGGRKLYLECEGTGSPVVVLEAGLRNRADIWSVKPDAGEAVYPQVAAFTRVCAYDRPGTTLGIDQFSRSDSVPMPRTAADAVADLHALLGAAAMPPPYVLAGHSTGGLIARLFASTYPKEVVGLVLVDAIPEGVQAAMTPKQWKIYDRLLLTDPPKELAGYKELETIDFDVSFNQMRAASKATPLDPIPFIVISKGKPFALPPGLPDWLPATLEQAWTKGQDELAQLLPNTPHRIATKSSHYVEIEEPQLVTDAIRQVVEAARAEKPPR